MSISGVGGMSEHDAWRLASPDDSPRAVNGQRECDAAVDRASALARDFHAAMRDAGLGSHTKFDIGAEPLGCTSVWNDLTEQYEYDLELPEKVLALQYGTNGELAFVLRSVADRLDGRATA